MKRQLWLGILLGLILLTPAADLAAGDIYVGGPYGTKISSLPYSISAPGAYYLGGNLSYPGTGNAITINSDDVTLDLMGFNLISTANPPNATGIYINNRTNVEIRNGTLSGWLTGISEPSFDDSRIAAHRIINVRIEGYQGAYLRGLGHLIQGCQAIGLGLYGNGLRPTHGMVINCIVKNFEYGILGSCRINGNEVTGSSIPTSVGIFHGTALVMGNVINNCYESGIAAPFGDAASLIGNTVQNPSSEAVGISVAWGNELPFPNLLDQNTVTGPGTHYFGADYGRTASRNNAGYP